MTGPDVVECDVEPPHRGEVAEDAFRAVCTACPRRRGEIQFEPTSGQTYVVCTACTCPRGWGYVGHRHGSCPAGKVPPPEIP